MQNAKPAVKRQSFVAAVLFVATVSPALAGPACTQKMTAGNWAVRCEGELPTMAGLAPTRSLYICTVTREGQWECSGTANLGGTLVSQTLLGQAQNEPDCTGFIHYEQTFNGQPGPPLEANYVILDDGSAIWGLPTNSGGVLACTLSRIDKR